MKITQENYEWIETVCEDEDWSLDDSYSGRGMYGKTCLAITVPNSVSSFTVAAKIFRYCVEALCVSDYKDHEDYSDNLYEFFDIWSRAQTREDDMGKDSKIIYWPNLQVEE